MDKDDPSPKALNTQGVSSIADLLTMTEQDITDLVYDDERTKVILSIQAAQAKVGLHPR